MDKIMHKINKTDKFCFKSSFHLDTRPCLLNIKIINTIQYKLNRSLTTPYTSLTVFTPF